MSRLATGAALLWALFGVATGNLYLPCNCHRADTAGASGRCCTAQAPARPSCCHAETRAPERSPRDAGRDRPHRCSICCMPRAPMDETPAAASVAPPVVDAHAVVCVLPSPWVADLCGERSEREAVRRTADPWLLSPEGLAVFLI